MYVSQNVLILADFGSFDNSKRISVTTADGNRQQTALSWVGKATDTLSSANTPVSSCLPYRT